MAKEEITLKNVQQDLLRILKWQLGNKCDWRLHYTEFITLAAVTGIIIMDIFLASLPSQYEPSLNSFMDFLTYLNSPEYVLYENTRKLQEGLKATRGY